jgi:hypothetical protein
MSLSPNGKYVVLSTDDAWYLIRPDGKKTGASVILRPTLVDQQPAPQTGYYSPDGRWLAVPDRYQVALFDTDQGKLVGLLSTNSTDPVLCWPSH